MVRTKEELIEMSKHLYDEYSEFVWLAKMLSHTLPVEEHGNMHLDSFVIHMRNLIDFFYADGTGGRDLVVREYPFMDETERNNRPKKFLILREAEEKADFQVAHLSYGRLAVEGTARKPWNISGIAEKIYELVDWFWKQVDRSNLDPALWDDSIVTQRKWDSSPRLDEFKWYSSTATTEIRTGAVVTFPRNWKRPEPEHPED